MKGKLGLPELKALLASGTGAKRKEVVLSPATGEDSAALDLAGDLTVLTMDPITGADQEAGGLAVHVCCNDLAATGAEPVGVLLTLLLPETASAELADAMMKSAHRVATQLNVAIVGGHTEFTPGLSQAIVCAAGVGRAGREEIRPSAGAREGDDLVLVGEAGLEGVAILAHDYRDVLEHYLSEDELQEALSYGQRISVVAPALRANRLGASALHDVTEGGILGAVYEMAEAAAIGVTVYAGEIPVSEVTRKLCDWLDIDPLLLISSGCLLVTTERGAWLASQLREEGHIANVIGRFGGQERKTREFGNLLPPAADHLWQAKEKLDDKVIP